MTEIWRKVVGAEGYEVSDLGRVRSVDRVIRRRRAGKLVLQPRRGKVLAPSPDEDGYPLVALSGKTRRVHLLVLEAFVGPCPEGHQALHGDGESSNPRLTNLRWGTPSENRADAVRHGTAYVAQGEEHGMSKLSEAEVREIRAAPRRAAIG